MVPMIKLKPENGPVTSTEEFEVTVSGTVEHQVIYSPSYGPPDVWVAQDVWRWKVKGRTVKVFHSEAEVLSYGLQLPPVAE